MGWEGKDREGSFLGDFLEVYGGDVDDIDINCAIRIQVK